MKTIINIGTNKGNITKVELDKPFDKITYQDVCNIVNTRFGTGNCVVIGWCNVTPNIPDDKDS
jgi:hypothetical protein